MIWTSTNGHAWTLLPHDPIFENGVVNLVPWRGELCTSAMFRGGRGRVGADAKMWSSLDGVTWQAEPLHLPAGLTMQFAVATSDGLWRLEGPRDWTPRPTGCRASCRESSHRPMAAPGPRHRCRCCALKAPSGELLGLLRAGLDGADGPGIYRTTNLETWLVLSGDPAAVGPDLIDVGGLLIMVGDDSVTGTCGGRCHRRLALHGRRPDMAGGARARPSGTMHHVAALADGTLVAVGSRVVDGDFPSLAAWVSVPVASPASTAEPRSVESPTPPTAPPVARAWEALGSIAVGTWLVDMVGFDGGYVAIQRQSKAWFSTDGTTWKQRTLPVQGLDQRQRAAADRLCHGHRH